MRRIVLTILMLAVLLPSAAFAGVHYLCGMDGQVRSACCCPAKTHKQDQRPERHTEIRGTCCCKVSTTTPTVSPQVKHEESAQYGIAPPPVAIAATTFAIATPERSISTRWSDPKPPKPERTLYMRNCALLL